MSEDQVSGQAQSPDAFVAIMGPIALDQAEKALMHAVTQYVGKIAAMKLLQPAEVIAPAMNMGEYLLIEFAQAVYRVSRAQATDVIRDAIQQVRHQIRKSA